MPVLKISTENAVAEQWSLLSQYSYPSNIQKFMLQRGFADIPEETIEFIAGSMRQSQAYFDATSNAPLDISPLLLYYGVTNLMMATSTMLTNNISPTKNHGMKIMENQDNRLADVEIMPCNPNDGALQLFSNVFSDRCQLAGSNRWSLGEIIGSIPDMKQDFENHYQDIPYYCVPIEVVRTRETTLERILNSDFVRYPDPVEILRSIDNFDQAYLSPQFQPEYIILFRKRNGVDIGNYSISGRKYLILGHKKQGRIISPHQIMLMFMGLYVLGFLPRYRPQLWNPLVRRDTTGERLIIEKFIAVCYRFIPNIILNFLKDQHVQFVNESEGILDLTQGLTQDDLKTMVKDVVVDMRDTGGFS